MAFSIFFSITVLLMISFAVTKKNLHLFEILFIWMIVNILHHNFLTVAAFNLGKFDIAEHPEKYWALVFSRITLKPLIIVWYFDLTANLRPYKIWAWLPACILLLVGVEQLASLLDLFKHTGWKSWWCAIEWFVIFLFVYFPWIWFRNLLRKELK